MSELRCVLLDADFISKLYDTRKDKKNAMIDRILELPNCKFYCHEQIEKELDRHDSMVFRWLERNIELGKVVKYSDAELIDALCKVFGNLGYILYMNMLKNSCDIFSAGLYRKQYGILEDFLIDATSAQFLNVLSECDAEVGQSNNLGEIKTYVMAQALQKLGNNRLYVFCSDDRKARRGMSVNTSMNCISALAAFVLLKNQMGMEKREMKHYFDSWMKLHEESQVQFKIYDNSEENRLVKIEGYEIFNMIYEGKVGVWKDGCLKMKDVATQ